MTRAELKEAFLANAYLMGLSNAMDYVKDPNSNPKPELVFDKLMDMAFSDERVTGNGYLESMQNDDFSMFILDNFFGIYLRNCLLEDLGSTFE